MRLITKSLACAMAVFSILLSSGCSKEEEVVVYKLTLSENSAVFNVGGGTCSIDVLPFPEDETWNAICDEPQDWFSFETDASSLTVTALRNDSTEPRSGSIRLTSPDGKFDPCEVNVRQEAAEPLRFSTSAADHDFDSEGGEYTFTVDSNYDWEVRSDASWLSVTVGEDGNTVTVSAQPNTSESALSAILSISAAQGELRKIADFRFTQGTRADNPYFKLLGQWEITAAKWFYSPNGSLNSLDYAPNPTDYYLIFDIEEDEYGESYLMKDFLYPGTSLKVRYDKASGNIVIPFGWTVYSYDTFLYITLISESSFSYASLEVEGVPSSDYASISLEIPSVDGFNYAGFGLWTYDDNGDKVAVGSRYLPTMFPMGPIVLKKYSL